MLPKKKRISRKEIPEILKIGKRHNSPYLLLYVQNKGLNESKFSFSLSNKVCQKAVQRNKYRRRGYSVISKNLKVIKPGFVCMFVFKRGTNLIKFGVIESEVLELLSTAGVLR